MENEILQQILSELQELKQGQNKLEQGQAEMRHDVSELKADVKEVKQRVTKIEVTLENETNRNINLLVGGHKGIVERLDGLKDIGEKVLRLQDSDTVQNVAIKELSRRTAASK